MAGLLLLFAFGCSDEVRSLAANMGRSEQALNTANIQVFARDEAPGDSATVKPRLYVVNNGSTALSNFKLHYYFTLEAGKTPAVEDWYTPHSSVSIEALQGELYRLVYDYAGFTLAPGSATDLAGSVVGLHDTAYAPWSRNDDWSYQGLTDVFSQTEQITVVDAEGTLIYGTLPPEISPDPDAGTPEPPADPVEVELRKFSITLPTEFEVRDVALGATEELRVNDGVRIYATNEVDYAPVTNVGAYTALGHFTRTGDVYGGGDVHLRGSIVQGDVVASGYFEQWGTTISGSSPPPTRPIVPHTVSWTAAFPTEVSTLGTGLSLTPAAGAYEGIPNTPNLTLVLDPGTYFFNSFVLEPSQRLILRNGAGPVLIYIKDGPFIVRGDLDRQVSDNFNILFAYHGTADVSVDTEFVGTIVAPNAKIVLTSIDPSLSHRGSFFGRSIEQHQHAHVVHEPFEIPDCAFANADCQEHLGCPLGDRDNDTIPDCAEERDPSDWTDPDVTNGVTLRWDPPCHAPGAGDLCPLLNTADKINACLPAEPHYETTISSGWDWLGGNFADICAPAHGFHPPLEACGTSWQLHAEGYIYLASSGKHCFAVQGDGGDSCSALLFGEAFNAITPPDNTVCVIARAG